MYPYYETSKTWINSCKIDLDWYPPFFMCLDAVYISIEKKNFFFGDKTGFFVYITNAPNGKLF